MSNQAHRKSLQRATADGGYHVDYDTKLTYCLSPHDAGKPCINVLYVQCHS
ncbi:hypothetical protein Pmar_PMAR021807 [Perkinsus marinus ATCC 50983]|uniref:Uncharacterized protein n=1 Tax=Perkinsus marinus (strain ATCC 50983 / TXsc) TaxID=423536 RepID=C5LG47_PERM5|nr:hypothetical protein Pmar_PMAR021807 [Perkinsus marinus ATCC 50983]EER04302.1 hypothetical protein Pmar_PMAR021807 [Perkinsus marinus ATCC 50983]|eukprot:XP_002772486.1 hypothetical protein Pmar_PMAR021807 [Perkinsus marinus ATCC 50983]